jgi:uncharacterized ferredoxin-like protein
MCDTEVIDLNALTKIGAAVVTSESLKIEAIMYRYAATARETNPAMITIGVSDTTPGIICGIFFERNTGRGAPSFCAPR